MSITYLFIDAGFNAWTQEDVSVDDWKGWVSGEWSIFKIQHGESYPAVYENASLSDVPDWLELMQK